MKITLSAPEFLAAVHAGMLRFATSPGNPATTYRRSYNLRIEEEIVGACAEAAVHKFLGKFWDTAFGTYHRQSDAPGGIEVRGTKLDNGSLIIRDNDADDRWYVLVTGEAPELIIRGFIKGNEAKQDKYVRNPHGHRQAWFVPQGELTPINESKGREQ